MVNKNKPFYMNTTSPFRAIVIAIAFFLQIQLVLGQVCGTISSSGSDPLASYMCSNCDVNAVAATCEGGTIRLFFHFVRRADGSGGVPANQISAMLNVLNNAYQTQNITFISSGSDEIRNNNLANFDTNQQNTLFGQNSQANAIDVYLLVNDVPLPRDPRYIITGAAGGIPGKSIFLSRNYFLSSTFPHELGHCLGLFHTHRDGREETGSAGQVPCAELINGSNCNTCGDYVCDTPADPNLLDDQVNSSCVYVGTSTRNGLPFRPDTRNIMSYTPNACRNQLTAGQAERIATALRNVPVLAPVFTPACPAYPVASYAGYLDNVTCDVINGWALTQSDFNARVNVSIFVDGRREAIRPANQDRNDVAIAFNNPSARYHGYSYTIPSNATYRDGQPHQVSVSITANGRELDASPKTFVFNCGTPPTSTSSPVTSACTLPSNLCYTLQVRKTGLRLQAMNDNTIQQVATNNQPNQIWRVAARSNNQMSFTVQDGTNRSIQGTDGANFGEVLELATNNGASNQQSWSLQCNPGDITQWRIFRSANNNTWDLRDFGNNPILQIWGNTSEPFLDYRSFTIQQTGCPSNTTPPADQSGALAFGPISINCSSSQLTVTTIRGNNTPIEYFIPGLRVWGSSNVFDVPSFMTSGTTFTVYARQSGQEISTSFTSNCPNGSRLGALSAEVIQPLLVTPNPSTGLVSLRFLLPEGQQARVRIVSILGTTQWQTNVTGTGGPQTETVDLGRSAAGIYFVNMQTDNSAQTTRLLIAR